MTQPRIWAIADLHLSFNTPKKSMDLFGEKWFDHPSKIKKNWEEKVGASDLVLIAGDISWATKLHQAERDLEWIGQLPGTKVMIRGNHDMWWDSLSKVRAHLPPSCHVVQNDVFNWQEISIGGTRLWDSPEYSFDPYIEFTKEKKEKSYTEEDARIFERELGRLEMSLKELRKEAKYRIALTHYPPIGPDLAPSRASQLFEKYHVDLVLFGHLHNVKEGTLPFGTSRGVTYKLTSCDALHFSPLLLNGIIP